MVDWTLTKKKRDFPDKTPLTNYFIADYVTHKKNEDYHE